MMLEFSKNPHRRFNRNDSSLVTRFGVPGVTSNTQVRYRSSDESSPNPLRYVPFLNKFPCHQCWRDTITRFDETVYSKLWERIQTWAHELPIHPSLTGCRGRMWIFGLWAIGMNSPPRSRRSTRNEYSPAPRIVYPFRARFFAAENTPSKSQLPPTWLSQGEFHPVSISTGDRLDLPFWQAEDFNRGLKTNQ